MAEFIEGAGRNLYSLASTCSGVWARDKISRETGGMPPYSINSRNCRPSRETQAKQPSSAGGAAAAAELAEAAIAHAEPSAPTQALPRFEQHASKD